MPIKSDTFSIIFIGIMLIGIFFSFVFPKNDRRHLKAFSVFVFGAVTLLALWLWENPDIISLLKEKIGWVLLSVVFIFIEFIKK